jgi:hypothetical protein
MSLHLLRVFGPRATGKAQYLFATIDKAGRQLGHVAPKYPLNLDKATTPGRLAPHRPVAQLSGQWQCLLAIIAWNV